MPSSSCEHGFRGHALRVALRAGGKQMTEIRKARGCLRLQPVVDPGPATFAAHHPGLAQHLEVMGDGGLTHAAAIGEVAGADLSVGRQLLNDRQSRRFGERLQDLHVIHAGNISTNLDIDKHQYGEACCRWR
jgi:hypothetical protein